MKNLKNILIASSLFALFFTTSCEFEGVNNDPDNILEAPIPQQLTSLTVNVGFLAGSDLNRFSSLIMQQYSGQSPSAAVTQPQQYETYLIAGSDLNNLWSSLYAVVLNDAENIIKIAAKTNSPHYSGVAKILKAYTYQIAVDTWGNIPYSETQLVDLNVKPKYDSAELIYSEIINLLDQGITEVSATTSIISPGANSTIYPGPFSASKNNWIKFANTLKMRLYLHYSEKNAVFAKNGIDLLISSGAPLFSGNADNFKMDFINLFGARNPIDQFQTNRVGNLVANAKIVSLMNGTSDPRRTSYFTQTAPGVYLGSFSGTTLGPSSYSSFNTYLRGAITGTTYTGAAPIRMLTFAEYNFIRAESTLRFATAGNAQTFYQEGIRASMLDAGVVAADITTFLAANGTLTGTDAQKLEQIINQKFIASYGVVSEPWTDWRRTGYPTIALPTNAVTNFTPRSLFYPQSEIDTNGENVSQKPDMSVRVFWDTRL